MSRSVARNAALVVLLATFPSQARCAILVLEGSPAATIVISREAADAKPWVPELRKSPPAAAKIRLAANELQRYLEKITGARLAIIADDGPKPRGEVVFVGRSRWTDEVGVAIPGGLTPQRNEEGYVIAAKGNTVLLAGNDAGPYQGTFFAVAEFLERQGVRWFMPGDFGEYVPHRASLSVDDFQYLDKPDFRVRAWNGNLAPDLRRDDAMWRLRNKLTLDPDAIIALPGDGSLRRYMPGKEELKSHPEYFAKKGDGSIDEHMVSLTDPEVPKIVAQKVIARIAAERLQNPHFSSLGIAPDDGAPMDFSAAASSASLGFTDLGGREGLPADRSISEEWFRFMNRVAGEVAKVYPDFVITTNGYANRNTPPEGVVLHPNLAVMFAAIWADMLHSYDDPKSWQQQLQGAMLRRWTKISPKVFVYNYNFPMLVTALTPMPLTRKIVRNTRLAKSWGVVGFQDEQTFSWMAHGITSFYLRSKLYWRAGADSHAILDDYFKKWYGPAAEPARSYWDAIEEALESTRLLGHEDRVLPFVYDDVLLEKLRRCQRESEGLAGAEPYRSHVHVDRLILEHLRHYVSMSRSALIGDYEQAIVDADAMFAQRDSLNRISPYFYWPESSEPMQMYFSGAYYWNLAQRRAYFSKLLDMINGKTGEIVARAPRDAMFAVDELDVGRLERWQDPDFDRSSWRKIDTSVPYYLQDGSWLNARGAPYRGYLWYIFHLELPSEPPRVVHILAPTVTAEAWAWTNGEFSGHREYDSPYVRPATMDFEVSGKLKKGNNIVAVLVSTGSPMQASEGLNGPLFVYSPK